MVVIATLTHTENFDKSKSNENKQQQWTKCLHNIHQQWTKLSNPEAQITAPRSTECIVISLPYSLREIHHVIDEMLTEHLPTHCFDIITDFMVPNKSFIAQQLAVSTSASRSINEMTSTGTTLAHWTPQKHAQLLLSEGIIIIDTKTGAFQSVPRHILGLVPDGKYHWQLSWPRAVKHFQATQIYSIIAHQIGVVSFPSNFHVSFDWSFKTDFTDAAEVGYLCDDGRIAFGDVERQNTHSQKIFVHYTKNADVRGVKCEWILVPNARICGPLEKKAAKFRDLSTFYSNPAGTKRNRRTRYNPDEDEELQRAIAVSLGQEYTPRVKTPKRQRVHSRQDEENEEDFKRAIAASLGVAFEPRQSGLGDSEQAVAESLAVTSTSANMDVGNSNRNGNDGHVGNVVNVDSNYMNWENEDDELQRAIAASLQHSS